MAIKYTDKLLDEFNLQPNAGHYFIVGQSNGDTTTQKNVVLEQQKRKLNIAGESKRRGKDDDEYEDQELEIDGGILTVKIEPLTREQVEVYKQIFESNQGQLIATRSPDKELHKLVNEFTLSGIPIISRVYIYQKTDINMSLGLKETKIKWLDKISDVCKNKACCYAHFFPHIRFCNEITLLNYEKNGNTNKRLADDIFLNKMTLPHVEFREYIATISKSDTRQKKRVPQKNSVESNSKFQKVLIEDASNNKKEYVEINNTRVVEKEEPEPEADSRPARPIRKQSDDDELIITQEIPEVETFIDENSDEDLLD